MLEACKSEEVELPILEVRDVKKVSLVVVTGDRGLCGGYNSQIIKQATKRIQKLEAQGIAVRHSPFYSYLLLYSVRQLQFWTLQISIETSLTVLYTSYVTLRSNLSLLAERVSSGSSEDLPQLPPLSF